jgi:RTA1 like protein
MRLGGIIKRLDAQKYAIISPQWLIAIFVLADISCFCTHVVGAGV